MANQDDKVGEHTEPSKPPSELLASYERVLQIASKDMPAPEQEEGMYGILGPPATPGESIPEQPSAKPPLKLPDLDPSQIEWLHSQITLLEGNDRFCRALRAILKNRQPWCTDTDLSGLLCFFVVNAVRDQGLRRQTRESFWSLQTGKTWKALKDFPGRLRNMAAEVEQVSRGISFDPQKWIRDDTPVGRFAKQQFARLPANLRVFAGYIERQIARLPAMSASQFPRANRGYSQFVAHISLLIKVFTGRYRDAETAELLESAALALGTRKRFDIQTLQKLRSRQKRRNKKS